MTHDPDADAFIVIHHPPDGRDPYGVGPFPPDDRLAEVLATRSACGCEVEVLWIAFPAGIKMLVGVDVEMILGEIDQIISETEKDRLN